jgi:hypothetical protein
LAPEPVTGWNEINPEEFKRRRARPMRPDERVSD